MEQKVKCKHCYSSKMCFETVVENYSSFLCFRCGYMSDSRLKPSTEYLEAYLDTTPYLVETLQVYDIDREIYWYPSVMNLGSKGIVFPIDDDSEYKWKACKFIDSNKDGYEKELDVENGKEFDKYDFVETLKFLNITVNIDNGQNTN